MGIDEFKKNYAIKIDNIEQFVKFCRIYLKYKFKFNSMFIKCGDSESSYKIITSNFDKNKQYGYYNNVTKTIETTGKTTRKIVTVNEAIELLTSKSTNRIPKYNIGDKIWVLQDGKIKQKIIHGVMLSKDDILYYLTFYDLNIETYPTNGRSGKVFDITYVTPYKESDLFQYKQDLIDSLTK